jgi:hypothetical protein
MTIVTLRPTPSRLAEPPAAPERYYQASPDRRLVADPARRIMPSAWPMPATPC